MSKGGFLILQVWLEQIVERDYWLFKSELSEGFWLFLALYLWEKQCLTTGGCIDHAEDDCLPKKHYLHKVVRPCMGDDYFCTVPDDWGAVGDQRPTTPRYNR